MIKIKLKKARKAMTMIETIFVLAIGSIFILLGIYAYNKMYIPTKASAEVQKMIHIIGGLERVKNSYNGGSYLASAAQTIPNIQMINDSLGGNIGTRDIIAWQYSCAAGLNSNIVLVTEPYSNAEQRRLMVSEINSQLPPWVAVEAGLTIQATRPNSVCN